MWRGGAQTADNGRSQRGALAGCLLCRMHVHRTHCARAAQLAVVVLALIATACGTVMPRDVKGNDSGNWDPPVARLAWSGGTLVAELREEAFGDRTWPMQGYATRYVTVDLQSGEVHTLGRDPGRVIRAVYLGHPVRCRISCDRAGACSVATPRGALRFPMRCPPTWPMAVACGGGRVVAACSNGIFVHEKAWRRIPAWDATPWSIEISGRRAYFRLDQGEFGGCLGAIDFPTLKPRCMQLAADGRHNRVSALQSAPDGSLWVAEGWVTDVAVYRIHDGRVTRELDMAPLSNRPVDVEGLFAGKRTVVALSTTLGVFEKKPRSAWTRIPLDSSTPIGNATCIAPGPFADDLVVGTANNGIEVWDPFLGARIGHVRFRR